MALNNAPARKAALPLATLTENVFALMKIKK
jgi:hypothetical protein